MKHPKFFIKLLIAAAIVIFCGYKIGESQKRLSDKMMTNDVMLSGIVTDAKVSGNHAFGILRIKILKSNVRNFNPVSGKNLFPYNIRDKFGEIYHQVPYQLKVGTRAELDSNKRTVSFYDGG